MTGQRRDSAALPSRRRWAFILLTGLTPIAILVFVELGLRVVGYGQAFPLFVPVAEAEGYLVMNTEMARRYFRRTPRAPTGLHDVFLAERDSSTLRIMVQGGSTAAGYPYYYGGSFSRMLEQRLQQTYPDRSVEVVNTAVAAVNSHTLLDRVDEILQQRPDAVLLYVGHNEYYGTLGVASTESFGRNRSIVQLYLRLQRLRLVQALADILQRSPGSPPEADSRTLMERMVGQQRIEYESAQYARGLSQFHGNLRAILKRYRDANVPAFVATVASNERAHSPFIGGPTREEAAWNAHVERAAMLVHEGNTDGALMAIEEAVRIDSLAAMGHYVWAQILERAGQVEEARRAYVKAKDLDQLRFRAPEDINRIIKEEAAAFGAKVVDVQGALRRESPDGIIGSELMLEHLHPNLEGYFVMADAFYEAMVGDADSFVPRDVARREVLYTAVDSLFGQYRLQQLMGAWPFQEPGVTLSTTDTIVASSPEEGLALSLLRSEATWFETMLSLYDIYGQAEKNHDALRVALAMVQQFPYIAPPYVLAARSMVRQRRLNDAVPYLEVALGIAESSDAHYLLGNVHLAYRRIDQALHHLSRAVELEPRNEMQLFQLAQAYTLNRNAEAALRTIDQLLELAPSHQDAITLREYLLTLQR